MFARSFWLSFLLLPSFGPFSRGPLQLVAMARIAQLAPQEGRPLKIGRWLGLAFTTAEPAFLRAAHGQHLWHPAVTSHLPQHGPANATSPHPRTQSSACPPMPRKRAGR